MGNFILGTPYKQNNLGYISINYEQNKNLTIGDYEDIIDIAKYTGLKDISEKENDLIIYFTKSQEKKSETLYRYLLALGYTVNYTYAKDYSDTLIPADIVDIRPRQMFYSGDGRAMFILRKKISENPAIWETVDEEQIMEEEIYKFFVRKDK